MVRVGTLAVQSRKMVPFAAVASVLLALLTWVPSASAAVGTADPGGMQMVCGNDTVTGLSDQGRFVAVTVPSGDSISLTASGVVTTDHWSYNTGFAEVGFNSAWAVDGAVLNSGTTWGTFNANAPQAGDLVVFPGPDAGGIYTKNNLWSNGTGVTKVLVLELWTNEIVGKGTSWQVQITLNGGGTANCAPSFQAAELFGQNPSMGNQCTCGSTAHAVNSLTGNEHFDELPGMSVAARGPGIGLAPAYNSLAASTSGPLGNGWSSLLGMAIAPGNFGSEIITQENGSTVSFATPDSGTTWVASQQFNATLVKNSDGTWTFTRQHRQVFTFDSTGRLISVADRNGNTTTLTYGSGGLSKITDDAGHEFDVAWSGSHVSSITDVSDSAHPRSLSMGYDSNGNLTSYTDARGGSWTLGYDSSHRLTSVLSPRFAGTTHDREFHYDAQGRVDWEQDPSGNRTTLTYDQPASGATEITDAAGNTRADYYNSLGQRYKVTTGYGSSSATTTTYAYDGNGMVTDRTDGKGHDWLTEYGDTANPFAPTKTTDPLGRVQTMTYDASSDLLKLVDTHGVETDRTYDANSNLTSVTVGVGTSNPATVTYHHGDASHPGDVTSITDARGHDRTYVYNATTGTLTSATDPDGNTTTWTYNPQGWWATKVSPRGNASGANPSDYTTSYTYNPAGQPLTVTDALGHTTTNTYDADGNVATTTEPDGSVTANTWTPDEQVATTTVGSGTGSARTLTYNYGTDGRVASHGYSTGTTYTETWNPVGLLDTSTDPNGHQTTYTYDANGNLTATTVAAGTSDARTTTYGYNADNERTSTTVGAGSSDAVTTTAGFSFPAGTAPCTGVTDAVWCTTTTNGAGNTTVSFHNALGQMIQTSRPGGKTTTYAYDNGGLQTSTTNPGGVTTTSNYDNAGRLTNTSNGQNADNVTYTYNADGQRHTMVDQTGTTTYDYNHAGQLTQITEPNGDHVGYTRDVNGRVSTLTYPDGRQIGYSFNAAGDTASLTDGSGGTTTFAYAPDGTLLTKHLPNSDTITNTIDGADQTTKIALTNTSGSTVASLGYTYTAADQIKSETDTQPGAVTGAGGTLTGNQTYTFDGQGRLKSSTDSTGSTTSYGFDADGNLTTLGGTTQTFNAADQLTSATTNGVTTTYTYNAAGNRTQTSGAGTTTNGYGYDSANRMTSATAAVSSPESDYHPITAVRILDTEAATRTGTCVGTCATIPAGGTLTFQATGIGGVPTTATSVMLNVSWLLPTGTGPITLYPAGSTSPSGRDLTATANGIETNAVLTQVSASGQVTISSSVQTDMVVEVNGYYTSAPSTSGAGFVPINGTRLLDTRNGTGPCTPSPCARMSGNTSTTIQITGHAGIPATGVVGVAYTLTDYSPSGLGYTTAWPAGQNQTVTANLTYGSGVNATALSVTPVGANGQIKLYSSADSDYTIDIAGYYIAAPNGSTTMYVPYVNTGNGAQRILDTHTGTGTCTPDCGTLTDGAAHYVQVSGTTVPADATSVVMSATVTTPSASGSLSIWPQGQLGSNNASLNYLAGMTTTETILTALGNGWIGTELHGATADLALDVQGYYLSAPITTTYTYNGDNQLTDTTTTGAATNPHYTYDPHTGIAQRINDHASDYIYGPDGALLETAADTISAPATPTNYYLTDTLNSVRTQIAADGTINTAYTYTPWGTGGPAYAGGYTDATTGFDYLLNRYQDAGTGQFTSVDPLVDVTGQAYTYADEDPVGEADPTGLMCSLNPFSGNNCIGAGTVAIGGALSNAIGWVGDHPVQATGIALGTISLVTGVGELAGASLAIGDLIIGPNTLGIASFATGLAGIGLDARDCVKDGGPACAGVGLSLPGTVSGVAGLFGSSLLPESILRTLDYVGFGTGALGFGWDTGASLFAPGDSSSGSEDLPPDGCK